MLALGILVLALGVLGDNVLTLTTSTFDAEVAKGPVLVKFYAPWCGHCVALAPVLEEAAGRLVESEAQIAKVDCTQEKILQGRFGIRSFPTLKLFKDGKIFDFKGKRTADAIVDYTLAMASDPVLALDAAEFENHLSKHSVVFLFEGSLDSKEYIEFENVARELQGTSQFVSVASDTSPTVSVRVDGLDEQVYTGINLKDWVLVNNQPLLQEFSHTVFKELPEDQQLAVIVMDSDVKKAAYLSKLKPSAKHFRGRYTFVYCELQQLQRWITSLGIKIDRLPFVFVLDPENDGMFAPTPEHSMVTASGVTSFLQDVLDGKIESSGPSIYNPKVLFKRVQKFLYSRFTEAQVMGVVAIGLILFIVVLSLSLFNDDDLDDVAQPNARRMKVD